LAKFDFDAAMRWSRFDPRRTLARRGDEELPFATAEDALEGPGLLLDTCVYIDQSQNRTPLFIDDAIRARGAFNSTIAIQEMMHAVGRLDPSDPRSATARSAIGNVINSMPEHRVLVPDAELLGRAALFSGILHRLQGHGREDNFRLLHDCVLFLQAQKLGLTLLTANVADFDIMLQLAPAGRVLFYRRS